MPESLPERWLRGPASGIPPLLQPVAHALLQAEDEIKTLMQDFPPPLLGSRPAGTASPAFHLRHIAGVLHRLCTYAKGEQLTEAQLTYLAEETRPAPLTVQELLSGVEAAVQETLQQLKQTDETSLIEPRAVGRKGLPSTVQGLLFHAAEHTMRHVGQLWVTVKVLKESQ